MPPRLSTSRILSLNSFCVYTRPLSPAHTRSLVTCHNVRSPRSGKVRVSSVRRAGPSREFHASSTRFAPKDPYKVLGVKKDASAADIKKTYFALARKYHPDTNPDKNAQDKFVEIQEAYDILKDDKKRADYDKYGAASQQPGFDANAYENARSAFGGGSPFGFGNFQDLSGAFGRAYSRDRGDLFETLFETFSGGNSGGQGFSRGGDIQASLSLSFMEACKGTTRTVNIHPVSQCNTCSGSGLKAGAKRSTCSQCGGSGVMSYVIQSGFHMQTTCTACHGTGSVVPPSSQCGSCGGLGQVKVRKTVQVDIPAGVEDGMTLKVAGKGDAPLGHENGRTGDLFVRIHVAQSKVFKRQGANLYHDIRIPVHTALLGGRVRVPTLDGEVDVRVPSGTQPGEQMVLKGHGIAPSRATSKGDMFVTFNVQLPRSLTTRQRELLQQFADEVEGKTPDASRQEARQDPPQETSTDGETPSGSRTSGASETNANDSSTTSADAERHKKREQEHKRKATA